MPESPKFTLNGTDLWKTIRGGILILVSVALTAIISYVAAGYESWVYNVCFDLSTAPLCIDLKMFAIPAIASLLELGRRFLAGFPR